jgi:hypothetical protein
MERLAFKAEQPTANAFLATILTAVISSSGVKRKKPPGIPAAPLCAFAKR